MDALADRKDSIMDIETLKRKRTEKLSEMNRVKRKRVVLNFFQRQVVIERLQQGVSHEKIAEEFNIGQSTLWEIKKRADENLSRFRAENSLTTEKKVFKNSSFPNVDLALKIWYYQERAKNTTITHMTLQQKAKEFYEILYPDVDNRKPFQASHGYVGRFCKRYSIEPIRNSKTEEEGKDEFVRKIKLLLEEYSPDQFYVADEFGLNYASMPQSPNLELANDDRVTLMACTNSTATHKLPLMFIHKDGLVNKSIEKTSLPVAYYHSKNSWITQEIFIDWFHNHFVPRIRTHLNSIHVEAKAVLLLDCGVGHPWNLVSNDGKIKCVFFPPDVQSLLNPMELGITTSLKRRYKINLVKNILLATEQPITPTEFFKTYTIKDVIYSISKIWYDFDQTFIRSAWHRLKFNQTSPQVIESVNSEELMSNFAKIGISVSDVKCNEWLTNDSNDLGFGFVTDTEIIDFVNRQEVTAPAEENTNVELEDIDFSAIEDIMGLENANTSATQASKQVTLTPRHRVITSTQALQYSSDLIKWLETQDGIKSEDMLFMQRIKEIAASKCYQNLSSGGNSVQPLMAVDAAKETSTFNSSPAKISNAKLA